MDQVKGYYKSLSVGMAIGVLTTSFFFAHAMLRPVRDGNRCLLAEAGS